MLIFTMMPLCGLERVRAAGTQAASPEVSQQSEQNEQAEKEAAAKEENEPANSVEEKEISLPDDGDAEDEPAKASQK